MQRKREPSSSLTTHNAALFVGNVVPFLAVFLLLRFSQCAARRVAPDSCQSLLADLQDPTVSSIRISDNLFCKGAAGWPTEIRIRRDLMISGDRFGDSRLCLPESTSIIIAAGSFFTFDNILILVRSVNDGITLPFLQIERGAEVFVEYSAFISESCRGIDITSIGRMVQNGEMGVFDAYGETVIHSCNTAHVCHHNGSTTTDFVHSDDAAANRGACERGSFSLDANESHTSNSAVLMITVVLSVVFGLLVVILIVALIFLLVRRNSNPLRKTASGYIPERGTPQHFKKLESGERGELTRHETEGRTDISADPLTFGNCNFKLSDIEIGEHLGRGSFGKVYKGHWQGTDVAVKCIVHGRSFLEARNEPFEAYLSRQVSHPNVVQTFIVHTVPSGCGAAPVRSEALADSVVSDVQHRDSNNESIMSTDDVFGTFAKGPGEHEPDALETWIVLEYCDRGSLARSIRDGAFLTIRDGHKTSNTVHALLTALDIAHAMMYLHNVRIIHGDLKAENVLLKSDASDPRGFVCKVGDFGLSRFLAEETHIETFTCGTITHMPPELLKGGVLTPAADVYSFAILMWELLTGTSPFGSKTHAEIVMIVVNRQKRPSIPDYCSEGYAELLEDCWRQSHLERPGFPEIVDRLKDLLEEETMERSGSVREVSTPVASARRPSQPPTSLERPSFPSCQPMSREIGWTQDTIDEISQRVLFSDALNSRVSTRGIISVDTRMSFDLELDGKSNPCFMMSTEMSAGHESIEVEEPSPIVCARITEADESKTRTG